jgi:hypothetical protein
MSGIIAGWSTRALRVFTSRKILRQDGQAIEAHLMRAAWLNTTAHGPYSFSGRPPWMADILTGDLVDSIRWARIATWGEMYDTSFRCKDCSTPIPQTIPLSRLPQKMYSDEALEIFASGENIMWTFPECGVEVGYKLSTGRSMVRADQFAKKAGRHLDVVMASRLTKIEGVKSPGKFVDFVADVSAVDSAALETELNRLEGGIDDDIELYCEECDLEQVQTMRMKPDFFRPENPKTKTDDSDSPKRSEISSPADTPHSDSESTPSSADETSTP